MRNKKPNQNNENKSNENEKLTIDELKSYKGFESYTDEDAIEMVDFIYKISAILYDFIQTRHSIL